MANLFGESQHKQHNNLDQSPAVQTIDILRSCSQVLDVYTVGIKTFLLRLGQQLTPNPSEGLQVSLGVAYK